VLLIGGAGFDPRATAVCDLAGQAAVGDIRGFFLREERPQPDPELVRRADQNQAYLCQRVPESTVERIEIFAQDDAVIAGRGAVRQVDRIPLQGVTDVFVDLSALSIGVSFPIVRRLLQQVERHTGEPRLNLHLIVADQPEIDATIASSACDRVSSIHGFQGEFGLDHTSHAARLWLPQLAPGKRAILERIRSRVDPHAVCPVLPFPASNPRSADELIEHYGEEFEVWQVDGRDIVYADEKSPLDLYRTILRIDDSRRRVFEQVGGSLVILSPLGSKALAIGALMAALERDFTVMYVESIGYTVDFDRLEAVWRGGTSDIVHVWLAGEAYANTV
jgi:hypothetical protein